MQYISFKKRFIITLVVVLIFLSFSPLVSSIVKNERNREIPIVCRNLHILSGNGTICGYVTDHNNSLPIENAKVDIERWGNYWNCTYTNSFGFYSISVPATSSIRLHVHANEYLSKYKGFYALGEDEILWVNVSLLPRPPETSIIYGYVKDNDTSEPIEGAKVRLRWRDEDWNHYYNNSYTDSLGFYSMNVGAPGLMLLCAFVDGYFTEGWPQNGWYDIDENETVWANLSMYLIPPENSIVCGYITDSKTNDPIEEAYVDLEWQDGYGHLLENDTFTDSLGFYSMNIAAGYIHLFISKSGYWMGGISYDDVGENETIWLNKSLEPRAPENAMVYGYITDHESGEPIKGAGIHLDWKDREGHVDWNWTNTNASGFYSFNVAEGKIKLTASKDGYYSREKGWYTIDENEKKQVDFELWPGIPSEPEIWGPIKGVPGVVYDYNFTTWDDKEYVWYYIEWGDGEDTGWIGPYNSGKTMVVNHTWNETGKYTIRAKAKDIDDRESGWGTLEIRMPRNRQATNSLLLQLLERFFNKSLLLRFLQKF